MADGCGRFYSWMGRDNTRCVRRLFGSATVALGGQRIATSCQLYMTLCISQLTFLGGLVGSSQLPDAQRSFTFHACRTSNGRVEPT